MTKEVTITPPPPEANGDDEVENNRRRDPELLAMERCVRLLDGIEPDARSRAMLWLNARYWRPGPTPSVVEETLCRR